MTKLKTKPKIAPLFWQGTVHLITCSQAPTSSTDINTPEPLLYTTPALSAALPCRPGSSINQKNSQISELLVLPQEKSTIYPEVKNKQKGTYKMLKKNPCGSLDRPFLITPVAILTAVLIYF